MNTPTHKKKILIIIGAVIGLGALGAVLTHYAFGTPAWQFMSATVIQADNQYNGGVYGGTVYGGAATDGVAPVLSLLTDSQTGLTSAAASVRTNEANGTLYWAVRTSASAPSPSQIISGSGAAANGSQSLTTDTAQSIAISGLSAGTQYYTHVVQADAAGNNSNVLSSSGFTTPSAPDITAPLLSSETAIRTGQTTGSASVTTDEAGGTLYWVVTTSATTPSQSEVQAGDNHTGANAVADGSQSVSATGVQTVSLTGLSADTTYYVHLFQSDNTGNDSLVVSTNAFTTESAPDTTSPVLSAPTATESGQTTANASVSTNETGGTLYWVVTTSPTAPSASQVESGNSHTGGSVAAFGNQAVSNTGQQTVSITGLSAATSYYTHFMQEDASNNSSTVVSTAQFTTSATPDTVSPVLSSQTAVSTGQTTGLLSVSSDEAAGTLYWVVTSSATTPSAQEVVSGENHTGSSAVAANSQTVAAVGVQSVSVTGLDADTTYYAHLTQEDDSSNRSSVVSTASFTTDAAVDTTAPTLSSGNAAETGRTTAAVNIETDEVGGVLYWVVTTRDTTPSAAQVIAGTSDQDNAATLVGTQVVSTTGNQSLSLVGLTDNTSYYVHLVHADASDNRSNVFTTGQFTTERVSSSSGGGGGGSSRSSRSNDDDDDDDEAVVETSEVAPQETVPVSNNTAPVETAVPAGFTFDRNISFVQPQFNESADVQNLEQFLNDFENESLPVDGVYGPQDNEAMKRFQRKYRREILDVWNLDDATGFVGITTRLKINFLLKGQSAQCPVFTEYNGGISPIINSPEIGRTQEILRDLGMYNGPIHNIWTPQVHEAMIVFQETFREVMLDPWNITEGTGYKYKTTNKFLNYFVGCDTGAVELEGVGVYEGI